MKSIGNLKSIIFILILVINGVNANPKSLMAVPSSTCPPFFLTQPPDDKHVCIGSNVTLTTFYPNMSGSIYSWSLSISPNPTSTASYTFTSLTNSVVINTTSYPIAAYNVFYTITNTCNVTSSVVVGFGKVFVYPPTNFNLTTSITTSTICPSQSVALFVQGTNNYTWIPQAIVNGTPTNATSTTTNSIIQGVHFPLSSTIYTVIGLGGTNICPPLTKTIQVNVDPIANFTINSTSSQICSGQSATLATNCSSSFTWYPSVAVSGIISPTTSTIYSLTAQNDNCTFMQTLSVNVSSCANINENDFSHLSVYPNPNQGRMFVQCNQPCKIRIFNSLGELVHKEELSTIITELNFSNLSKGVYLIQQESVNSNFIRKIVIN